jgi:hypothetical protein
MKAVRVVMVSSALMILMGCGGGSFLTQPSFDSLQWAQTEYTQSMRWNNRAEVFGHVVREDRPELEEMLKRFNAYRITDFEVGGLEMNPDNVSATGIVIYRGYSNKRLIEIELIEDQEWYWLDERGKWFLRPSVENLTIRN